MASTVEAARVAEFLESEEDIEEKVRKLAEQVRLSKYTVFFTGAGVSTSAGIGDYRGPRGCWTQRRVTELGRLGSTATRVEREELERLRKEQRKEVPKAEASLPKLPKEFADPAFSHMAMATLVHQGLAHYVITTNLDGLFRKAGLRPHTELCCLHGDIFVERCTGCNADFERNYRVRRAGGHVHDHRAVGTGTCPRCGSSTPAGWTGNPWVIQTKIVTSRTRPAPEAVTSAKLVGSARRKWPGAVLVSLNDVTLTQPSDGELRKAVEGTQLPLRFAFQVRAESRTTSAKAMTGGSTTFAENGLVGSAERDVGTKDTHINFGEGLDDLDWDEAGEHCAKADLCIVLGTSMTLPHVVHFPFMAKKTVIVNLQATPYDDRCWEGLRLWGTCDDVLRRLLRHLDVRDVESIPAWRPLHALPLEDLKKLGLPANQMALARHIEEMQLKREVSYGPRDRSTDRVEYQGP